MKILLAVDGSSFTKRMLGWLAANGWFEAGHSFTVAHAVGPLPHRAAVAVGQAVAHGYYEDEAETVFRPIRAFFAEHGVSADFVYHVGHAGEVIAEMAGKPHHELVVMGSHGHGELAGLVLGSVTTKVLARCRTPVLVIR